MNADITKALVQVQTEIQNPSNTATNPFFKSGYAPLPEILNEIRPLLAKHKLAVIQNTGSWPDGTPYVQTILVHENGESYESDKLSLKPDKKTPQGVGSAITYGRRYQLTSILGIVGENDDDGNAAEKMQDKKPAPKSQGSKSSPKSVKKSPSSIKKNDKEDKKERVLIDEEVTHLKKKNGQLHDAIDTLQAGQFDITQQAVMRELTKMRKAQEITADEFKQARQDLKVKK